MDALELTNVTLRRGRTEVLADVSWRVPAGACCAVLGPNGSGKSTLARMLAGYEFPTTGEVVVLGRRFGECDLAELRRKIRLVQASGPADVEGGLSAEEVVCTGFYSTLGLYDRPGEALRRKARGLLRRVGLTGVADHAYATLSSGEKVRALMARAWASSPGLLILDEPTAGLDILGREQVMSAVGAMTARARPPAILIITHHVEELPAQTSHVLLLKQGRVVAGGRPGEVLNSRTLSIAYGCAVKVTRRAGRHYLYAEG